MTAGMPPAKCNSSIWCAPAGESLQRLGVLRLTASKISKDKSNPASRNTAGKCKTVLVEQPNAMSTATALLTASWVTMSDGRMFFSNNSITFIPAFLARRMREAITAGVVPLPGRARPMVSERQFMELAVNMPAQEPQPGQAPSANSSNCSSVIWPLFTRPTPSKTVMRSVLLSLPKWGDFKPANMGPPLMRMEGMFKRSMAMSMPGTLLSQLGMKTKASKGCAQAIISMESAMISREGKEKCIPLWFMAKPSHTAMAGNSMGVPPARRTPDFTASAIRCRWICPGTISLAPLTMPTKGRSISSRVRPRAYKRERCGAFSRPAVIFLLRIIFPLLMYGMIKA